MIKKCGLCAPVTNLSDTNTNPYHAFEAIFHATKERLQYFAGKFVSDPTLREDLIQSTYLKLWENFDKVTDLDNPLPLLYTYLKNLAIDTIRKEAKTRVEVLSEQVTTLHEPNYGELSMEIREVRERIDRAIARLPERKRMVFYLKRVENLTYREIAERLNISFNTVENHMSEALKILRRELRDEQAITYLTVLTLISQLA